MGRELAEACCYSREGSAGLGSILTAADYELLITTSLDETPEDYPVLCGVLESSTVRALERVRLLESLGAKAFVHEGNRRAIK